MDWNYQQPVKIIFGNGKLSALKEVIAELGETDGILICSRSFRKSGLADKVMAEADGLLTAVYSDVSPNPEVSEVDACAELMREQGSKFVVALGGGSVMDLAKAAATIATVRLRAVQSSPPRGSKHSKSFCLYPKKPAIQPQNEVGWLVLAI